MIEKSSLRVIGKLLKPHGISGEITALLTDDVDLESLSCIVLEIDGIFVPFFLNSVRAKSSETDLVTIDGVTDEDQAARLCSRELYAFVSDLGDDNCDDEGFYAADIVGFDVVANEKFLGKITDIDDTTSNYLFIIEKPDGSNCLIPVADEFIIGLDSDKRVLSLELPEGLLDL